MKKKKKDDKEIEFNIQLFDFQTDLSCRMNSTSCPWWHFLMQFTQMALRSVVLQVWHLRGNEKKQVMSVKNDHRLPEDIGVSLVPRDKQKLPVKIVHWIAGVTWNLVQALTSAHSLLNGILVVDYFIIWGGKGEGIVNLWVNLHFDILIPNS